MLRDLLISKTLKDPVRALKELHEASEDSWIKKGEERALNLFKEVSQRVPAYKDFLKKNNIDPKKIKTIEDFKQLPLIDKDNYLRAYPLEQLCWDGELSKKRSVFSSTSGSTGEPFYFPREQDQDWQYAIVAEMYLRTNFEIHKKTTLYIDGFAMGAWIGGLFTYQAIKYVAERGEYPLSIITPGIFKKEIIKAVKNLGHKYDQIIIGGYPPMIKDMIDDGIEEGVSWEDYNLGFIFSAEGFSEKFRDYIIKKTNLKSPYKSTLNHYGTVDLGTMAHETPISILIRRLLDGQENNRIIFPEEHRQPTLVQFIPELFFFEEVNSGLVCSAYSGIPLVRYDLKDYGGVLTKSQIEIFLSEHGIGLKKEIQVADIEDTVWNLPFVYIYERSDFTVKLYGANIYPETIRKTLCQEEFENSLTGKFTMEIGFDDLQNQKLVINLELKTSTKESDELKNKLQVAIVQRLLKENSEYKSNYKESPDRQVPEIIFRNYEDQQYFMSGGKQKWVKK